MSQPAKPNYFTEALARARSLRTHNNWAEAWKELRAGLDAPADFSTATSAAKFLNNTPPPARPNGWPVRRVALIGANTLTFLLPLLRALAFRDGWWPEFYESPFGTWRQEILEPRSALRQFNPEVTLLLRSWREVKSGSANVVAIVKEETALAQLAAHGLGLVLWPSFDIPGNNSALRATLAEVNAQLRAALPSNIIWADITDTQKMTGENWSDERLWEALRQHPSPSGSVAVVELWLSLLRARWGQARKVLVTDLDDVLWGGIAGEDGIAGVRIGAGTPAGEAHTAYQNYLRDLKERGTLLAVCSKNNEADVLEIFSRRQMPLRREDFTGWMVNWNDKAENLRALAAKLHLGLDSFVFVDDHPAERARVRQALPEVAVPELSVDPAGYVPALRARRFFDTITVSAEDRNRTAAYQANEQREELRAGFNSLEDFLRGLEMQCEQGPVTATELDRIEQLLARTNQWNLTTRRHSRAEIQSLLSRPGAHARWFRLRDRFGDNGLVSFWIVVPGADGEWEIDSWVMSCRVIGRGLEDLMFNELVSAARSQGVRRLRGIYLPTAKNNLVAGLLPGLGFTLEGRTDNGGDLYTLELVKASERPHVIR
ncbi:MAG TPA: HAD-IIIC family phosphatase [Opitutales bacterium]|jgi:FkbH-like protein|nr:HAD-IIIC family phosphatase [Opitutales bacterium]